MFKKNPNQTQNSGQCGSEFESLILEFAGEIILH